jgi:peptide/nickel transport system substrate-binding protein
MANRIRRRALALGALLLIGLLPATTVGAQDAEGGTLSFAVSTDVTAFDPALAYDALSQEMVHLVFDSLITFDDAGAFIPGVADLPVISADGLRYTFTIRPDISFVRHGEIVRTMTADDVVASINRLLRPDVLPYPSPIGPSYLTAIAGAQAVLDGTAETASGVKALDDHTVEVSLDHPDRGVLNILASSFGAVVPAELAGVDANAFGADPVGTGPYTLESYTPGVGVTFARNPHYWQPDMPKADAIDVRLLVPPDVQVAQATSGDLDIAGDQIPSEDWTSLSTDPAMADRIVATDPLEFVYLTLDTSGPESPFTDVLVRQAVSHAIDKQNLLRLAGGRGTIAGCLLPAAVPGGDPACDPYPYSVDTAKALMSQAGNTGFSTQLYTTPTSRDLGESIAADLAVIGIDVEVIPQDFDVFLATVGKPHGAPMAFTGWGSGFPDPSEFIDPLVTCAAAVEGGSNLSWYCDPELDTDLAAARQLTDRAQIIETYADIQDRVMAAAPIVPLRFPTRTILKSDRLPTFTELDPVWIWDLATYPVTQ